MFNIQELITYIETSTTFPCEWAEETQPNFQNISDLEHRPRIMVGGWRLRKAAEVSITGSTDPYEQYAEDLTFGISIHIVSTTKNLAGHWKTLYNALLGWSPYNALEKEFSGLTYARGDMMGVSNARCWWLDEWALSFPAVTLNQP